MRLAPRTLKGQLTLLFLVFTLVPSLLITGLAIRQLFQASARTEHPVVQEALGVGKDLAQSLLALTENDLRQRGQLLAADPVLRPPLDADAIRDRLAGGLNLDFVQLYDTQGRLVLQVTRDPQLAGLDTVSTVVDLAASERAPFLEARDQDALAYVGYAGNPAEAEWILVAGVFLENGFYTRKDALQDAIGKYKLLPALVSLNQKLLLLTLGVVLVLMAVTSTVIARKLAGRVSRPVEALGTGMSRVTHGEDQVRVDPAGTDEMERLIRTFNIMSGELSRSRRELARAERLSAWRDIARRVAHEMKNALTPITFSASRLKKTAAAMPEAERERVKTSLDTVLEEVEGLRRLAASFSEVARLPVPELISVDLGEVAAAAASGFPGEEDRITWTPPAAPVRVEGDRTLLRQALANLIKNAVEATPGRERIWVRVEADGGRARVVVEDAGPGWPEGEREHVLDPYVTTKTEGTGLGLSLVQRTALQHGGSVELEDRPGGGARVTLFLPMRAPSPGGGGPEEQA